MDLTTILDLIREHGELAYGFLFAHCGANSLLAMLFAGYAAHLQAFDFQTVVLVGWAGGFLGDAVRFWIGRRWGHSLVRQFPRIERGVDVTLRLIHKHHLWMILIHRYPHGIRGLAGLVFGMSGLAWSRFLAINFVSAGIWAFAVASLGYGFGHLSEKVLGQAASGAGFVLLVVFLGLAWLLSKRLERAIERG
jgi:membrane protein DedA with SNARE-associated domain